MTLNEYIKKITTRFETIPVAEVLPIIIGIIILALILIISTCCYHSGSPFPPEYY